MKTCFSTVTAHPGARWNFLGRFACITFVFASTTSLSFAGFQDGGEHASRGSFAGSVPRIGLNAPHGSVAAHNPNLNGNRGEPMGHPASRGPLVGPNRETVGDRNGFVPSLTNQMSTVRRQGVVPQTRELNPSGLARPFGARGQGPQRDSTRGQGPQRDSTRGQGPQRDSARGQGPQRDPAAINAHSSEIGAQHPSPNHTASEDDARINEKFQRYENKFASYPQVYNDRKEKLNRTRAFLFNLIGLGYAPLTVDSWCDDLLDDRVDDGMPMDLVDTYWGQPVDTQEFVQYYVPYDLYTYRTDDGNYHQVTYKDGVVSTPNAADVQTH
jgi:hypothetical protein